MDRTFIASCVALSALLVALPFGGCSSNSDSGPTGPTGGPVVGLADVHCGTIKQVTSQDACHPVATDAGPGDTSASDSASLDSGDASTDGTTDAPATLDGGDAGDDSGGGDPGDDYGATEFNSEGDDDQCKYHASFTVDPVRENQDIYFTVVASTKVDGKPLKGAAPRAEVFLDDTHPAPNSDQHAVEGPDGTYKVGPIQFDASGQWTVRFHFYEDCVDGDESPHGHIAFFIKVP